ncbi:NDR1/HIN1-like protein 6 [Curcuma longa]|uniref:NDR1/HIN1-like protein 6 n=1 Tax=Curcuma longa TaxID=136217 RepID=UPI003D9EB88E
MASKHGVGIADHQRIHPADIEAHPPHPPVTATAPLVPRETWRSDKGDPEYPRRGDLPLPPPKRRRRGGCCCRLLCCAICAALVLAVALAVTAGVLYLVFDPKLPSYSVDRLRVAAFGVDANLTARATFDVTVTATNPNKGIGIYYEQGSRLSVLYAGYELCEGSLPAFYQGHRNTTVLAVGLTGAARLGSELMRELLRQEQGGAVPLDFAGDVPVRVKLGRFKLWKVTSRVRCALVVDSLNANVQIKIRSSSCKFSFKL